MSSSKYDHRKASMESSPEVEKIDITNVIDDMFKEFLKIWWLLVIILSIMSTIFYFQRKMTYEAYYEASATYTVNVDSPYSSSSTYYQQTAAGNLGKTLEYLLSSASMQRIVAEDLGVKKVPGEITVTNMESTNLLTITTKCKNPEVAYNMLQSILRNYESVCRSVIGSTVLTEMDQSGMPTAPINPGNYRGAAKSGFMAGIAIDLALLCFLAMTKKTIRKEEDFEKILNVECYGAVPLARFKKRGRNMTDDANLILIDNYRIPGGFLESIRAIRTKLERDANKNNYKVFLVSSAIPSEGKSTVSSNLAIGLARKGKSVVLVDFDLRSPSLAGYLNITPGDHGTSDVLLGKASLESALIRYKKLPLEILPGGTLKIDAMRLLNSNSVPELIAKLRDRADYVILDAPPAAMLADAGIIARYADAAVFVVRQDYSRFRDIIEGVSNLSEEGIPIAGCILNLAEVGITGYGYGSGYGYGRGYGSYGGYGSYRGENTKEKKPEA